MPFFASKKSSPHDLVEDVVSSLKVLISSKDKLNEAQKKSEKVDCKFIFLSGDLDRSLRTLHSKLHDNDPSSEMVAQLCHEIYSQDLIVYLIAAIPLVEFENRKDIIECLCTLGRQKIGARMPTVEYIYDKPDDTIFRLLQIYSNVDAALHVGILLRDFAKIPDLCSLVLLSEHFFELFDLIQSPIFDVSTDAISTLKHKKKEFILRHKDLGVTFFLKNHDKFFDKMKILVVSDNYVMTRQSLKLICEVIHEKSYETIMFTYISSSDNLKDIMNLLRNKSQAIQCEAFHIFKVFVANPSMPNSISSILKRNKEKLIEFLTDFYPYKDTSDAQFNEEKKYLIKIIDEL
ncbi:hypothetical protein MXB_228 [Myxobolus squamalis]|nr:hypothetical protein MXB_228 [Myxobolus squamalis]